VGEDGLPGGSVSAVVRVGDTVRRPAASPFVRRVLIYLGERGWAGAPRWLGVDERGRDVLSYLDGDVPWQRERQPAMRTDAALAGIATLVRELHDLTAGTELAEGGEVVCHNDLSPRNTVYRDLLPQPSLLRRLRRSTPSLSAFVLLLGVRGRTPNLAHHNVLFPAAYDDEFDAIFGDPAAPVADPTIYISVPDDPAVRPEGGRAVPTE